jgi:hypothetical protein
MARRQSAREEDMAKSQELSVQQKKELTTKEEKTVPARYYVPNTDIYETDEALTLVLEVPGVASPRRTRRMGRAGIPVGLVAEFSRSMLHALRRPDRIFGAD